MQRPAVVTTFGVLNIVFAGFGIFARIGISALFTITHASNNPAVRIMRDSPAYAAWMKVTVPLALLSCAVLLAAGIGLLRLRGWGRKLSIGYAIYAILFGLAGLIIHAVLVLGPLFEEAARTQGPEAAGAMGGALGGTIGGFFGLAYPILLLFFMLRQPIAAAFRPPDQPPALPPRVP